MKLTATKKAIIIFSVLIVVLLALHYVAFSFIRSTGASVSSLESDVTVLRAQVLEFSKYSSEDMKNLASSVADHFISRTNIVTFIESLEKEARARNVTVVIRSVGVEPRSDNPDDDKETIRLKFETHGSWADTMNFVAYVEHLPYKIDLHGLALATVANGTDASNDTPADSSGSTKTKNASVKARVQQWQGQFEITTLKFK